MTCAAGRPPTRCGAGWAGEPAAVPAARGGRVRHRPVWGAVPAVHRDDHDGAGADAQRGHGRGGRVLALCHAGRGRPGDRGGGGRGDGGGDGCRVRRGHRDLPGPRRRHDRHGRGPETMTTAAWLAWLLPAVPLAAGAVLAGAMLLTVTAATLALLLMGWEVMGAASYALIGYWWRQPRRVTAANTAFLTTRAGDLGLYIAAGAAMAGGVPGLALGRLAAAP